MTQQLTTTSILSLFETNKEQRQSFALGIVDALQNGEADPLKIHLQVKCMEDIIKLLNSNTVYKSSILEAAEKHGQKSFEYMNSRVEIKEVGTRYDYSQCGDPVLRGFEQQFTWFDTELKARQKFLQTIPAKGMELMIDDELVTVYPPSKSSTTSVAITLK